MLAKCLIFLILVTSNVKQLIFAIDPDYVIEKRIAQVLQALVNTLEDTSEMRKIPNARSVTFWCTKPNQNTYQEVYQNDPRITEKIDMSLPIGFIIHGWFDGVNRTWMNNTLSAYVEHVKSNVCGVDWSRLALTEYSLAANNTKIVAKYIVKFIEILQLNGLLLNQVILIGHSMGAHIAGIVGHQLNGKVSRIIGLDPAGWLFTKPYLLPKSDRLDKNDAKFVQAIHTDTNYFGLGSDLDCGHQDFYPNGGASPQPGCIKPIEESGMTYLQFTCSHYKAVQFFQQSLNPKNKFIGYPCVLGYFGWVNGWCQSNVHDTFGVYASNSTFGRLYFRSSPFPPFTI